MNNIFLIGMIGSGKSTIAPILNKKLNLPYIDTDIDLSSILDMSMKDIFKNLGEKKFRILESVYFREQVKKNNYIYALGGGIILNKKNRELIKNNGISIFLDTSKEELINRLKDNIDDRPLIHRNNINQSINEIYNRRYDLYKQTSHYTLNCDTKNINQIVKLIISKVKNAQS